ncbi:hypothetical protein [Bogoriella caseilytica]|uniref:Uncharacterized protein n=1 Tax=Bogoriella caseilytica TaxID=56055 RepID=A0A3N2BFF3_9MICO|nr:hypothetical protein [Bogoriella caseilytica]ROR73983.1 hypothetical protein EDD31_2378 [Bogoriella caseilytica]
MQAYPRTSTARPQWQRLARMHVGLHLYLSLWFWAIVAALWIVVVGGVQLLGGVGPIPEDIEMSYFQFTLHATLWFSFSVGIASAMLITSTVGNGATRRSFASGALVGMLAGALLHGTVMAFGFMAEGWVYEAAGWSQLHVSEAMDGGIDSAQLWQEGFLLTWSAGSARVAGGIVAGLLVGMNYYRFGGWRGTALLPLGLIPAVISQDDLVRWFGRDLGVDVGLGALAVVVLVVVGSLVFRYLAASAVIKQQWSRHGE